MTNDKHLRAFATPRQLEYLDAIKEHGSLQKAGKALKVSHGTIGNSIKSLERRASRKGKAPGHFENGVAPGYQMGKVTVQRAADGSVERT